MIEANDPINVLYVDDDPNLLEIGKIYLERGGEFKAVTIATSQSVIGELEKGNYEAIVSDYQMPELDGIGLLKKVREKYPDLPFILFTGKGREEIVIEAINNGATFYLQKGGDPTSQFAELGHKIKQAVGRIREGSEKERERDAKEKLQAKIIEKNNEIQLLTRIAHYRIKDHIAIFVGYLFLILETVTDEQEKELLIAKVTEALEMTRREINQIDMFDHDLPAAAN